MSRLRRFSLPTSIFAAAVFICGKLLLTPVKTFEVGRHGYGSWGAMGAIESGWPWIYWKRMDGIVFPPNPPSILDISYSRWLFVADVTILLLLALAAWLVSFWLWRRCQYRFQYSLRGLLLATVLIAMPMGWMARQIYDWRREQFWIAELGDVNILVGQDDYADLGKNRIVDSLSAVTVEPSDFSEWLGRLWPDTFWPVFRRAKSLELKSWVTLRPRPYEPVLEAALHEMQNVRELQVARDCEFRTLDSSAFANIENLAIDEPINDQMLQTIATFPRLRSLHFIGSKKITVDGFARLAHCRHLEELSIWSFSPAAIEQLANCSTLRRLQLSDSNISDADLAPLARLKQLQYLSLSSSQITDAAINKLAELPALEELKVDYPNFTDAGAKRLCELPRLRSLSLNDRLISSAASRQLKDRIPILELC